MSNSAKTIEIEIPVSDPSIMENLIAELSVIGFDGIRDSEYLAITTIHKPLFDSGAVSVELLLASLLEDSKAEQEKILPTKLMVRGKTAPPR